MIATACCDILGMWDFEQPAVSEERFRECMDRTEDPTLRAEMLTQVARALGLQRRFDEASDTLGEVEGQLNRAEPRARVRWLLETGRVLNSSGRRDEAVGWFDSARTLASEIREDFLAVDAAHMLGIAANAVDVQIRWHEWGIERAKQSSDAATQRWIGSLTNNLGWTLHDQGRYAEALGWFEQGLDWRREHGDVKGARIANWTVGRCLRSLDRVEEALARQRELRAELDAVGEDDPYVEEEIGECLLAIGSGIEATPHFGRAWAALSGDVWLSEQEPERLERLRRLAGATAQL